MLRIRDGRKSGVFLACWALVVGVAAVAGQDGNNGGQARNLVLGTQNGLLAQVRSCILLWKPQCGEEGERNDCSSPPPFIGVEGVVCFDFFCWQDSL